MHKVFFKGLVFTGLLGVAQVCSAHTGVLPATGLADGLWHPFLGIDHLLVMLGVGLWAGTQRRQSALALIGVFLAGMLAGAVLGMHGLLFQLVESAVLGTLIAVGVLLAAGKVRFWQPLGLAIVAASAVLHGLVHGAEMPETAQAYAYITGIVSASAILQGFGLICSLWLSRLNAEAWVRIYGSVTGLAGAWLLMAA